MGQIITTFLINWGNSMAPNTADVRRFLTDLFSDEELTTVDSPEWF
jgi:protoheme ferro-lyase